MKPFDLEKALAGDPVVTRSNKNIKKIFALDCSIEKPVLALIEDESSCTSYYKDGHCYSFTHDNDLFMKEDSDTQYLVFEWKKFLTGKYSLRMVRK